MWGGPIPVRKRHSRWGVPGIVGLALLATPLSGQAAQQIPSKRHSANQSEAVTPVLQQAQELIQKGEFQQARKLVQGQLDLNPSSVEAYNLLGITYTSEKDYDKALAAFQHALKLAPDSAKTHNNLGNLLRRRGETRSRGKRVRRSPALAPANRDANYNLGLVLLAKVRPPRPFTTFNAFILRPLKLASTWSALIFKPDKQLKV